jgi:predicted transcriptional regulator
MSEENSGADFDALLLDRTTQIVAAFVSHNHIQPNDVATLITNTHSALRSLATAVPAPVETLEPAVPIKKSITPDFLICLDDGRKLKSLKRHLSTLGMTPNEYREKWGLRPDYPMVAPNYSATRSSLAKSNGLGRKPAAPPPAPAPAAKPKLKTKATA